MNANRNTKFIAIGDMTTDAFIELEEAKVDCNLDNENCTISMRWGDKIPYKDVVVVPAVGNSPNASVSAARLGLDSSLISFVGSDDSGYECIKYLKSEKVKTDHIDIQQNKKTNYHYVLSFESERTILIRHQAFTYKLPNFISPNTRENVWIYFSSLGEAGENLHYELEKFLSIKDNKNIKLVFQPGTFQLKLGYEKLNGIYERSDLVVCNKNEAKIITKKDTSNIKELLQELKSLVKGFVVITDGPNGAYATDGNSFIFIPKYPDIDTPKERTGAGDAFSSTLAVCLAKGFKLEEALLRAPINSMNVVQHIGAQAGLLNERQLETYLKKAPSSYKISKL